MEKYAYIRVSTKEQNPERQYFAIEQCGVMEKNIFMDQMSGKDFRRPEYQKMLSKLKQGDLLVIKSIDRLGRNYEEILGQWREITKEVGADIQVIDMPLLNTGRDFQDLTGEFISELVLQILAYVAEIERSFIRQRQAEGIAAAKAKGIKFGRARQELPAGFISYYQKWKAGKISIREAAKALDISHSTFYRRCKEMEGQEQGQK